MPQALAHERIAAEDDGDVVSPAAEGAPLVAVEPELSLEVFVDAFSSIREVASTPFVFRSHHRGRHTSRKDPDVRFTSAAELLSSIEMQENTMATGTTHTYHLNVTLDLLDRGIALHHPNHLVLAERARAMAFEELGSPVDEMWKSGFVLLVRSISVEYLKPIFAGARITIVTRLRPVSESAVDVEQRFLLGRTAADAERSTGAGPTVCELRIRLVCANLIKSRVEALPRALRNALSTGVRLAPAAAAS
jgi:acyl-CoA thioesterase FadM